MNDIFESHGSLLKPAKLNTAVAVELVESWPPKDLIWRKLWLDAASCKMVDGQAPASRTTRKRTPPTSIRSQAAASGSSAKALDHGMDTGQEVKFKFAVLRRPARPVPGNSTVAAHFRHR